MLDRILIVGLGSIGSRHARVARELNPQAEIVALRHRGCGDPLPDGLDGCVTTVDDALRFRPAAAVVAGPASTHVSAAMPLALAGVHLLIEKPISDTRKDVAELIRVCDDRAVVLMVGYNLRFSPSLLEFKIGIDNQAVGRVVSVRAEVGQHLSTWRGETDYRKSVSANASLGGGVLLELSHEIDYLRWIFGRVDSVNAVTSRLSDLEVDVDDSAFLILTFADGLNQRKMLASLNMDFVRYDTTRGCTAIGETGSLRWNAMAGTVELLVQGDRAWRTIFASPDSKDDTYFAEWKQFMACIESASNLRPSGSDGLAALEIIEAAVASSARGGAVVPVRTQLQHD